MENTLSELEQMLLLQSISQTEAKPGQLGPLLDKLIANPLNLAMLWEAYNCREELAASSPGNLLAARLQLHILNSAAFALQILHNPCQLEFEKTMAPAVRSGGKKSDQSPALAACFTRLGSPQLPASRFRLAIEKAPQGLKFSWQISDPEGAVEALQLENNGQLFESMRLPARSCQLDFILPETMKGQIAFFAAAPSGVKICLLEIEI